MTAHQHSQAFVARNVTEMVERVRVAARKRRAETRSWLADLDDVLRDAEADQPVHSEVERALDELEAIIAEGANQKPSNATRKFTRKSPKRKLKSAARDARNINKCKRLSGKTATRNPRPPSRPLVGNTSHPNQSSKTPSLSRQKHLNADRNDARQLASWRNTTDLSKMFAVGQAIKEGGGMAFTLNLAGKVKAQIEARPNKALRTMSDRLMKSLKAEFGHRVEVAFVLEVSPAGHIHLHGILALDPSMKERARAALEKAGGLWTGQGAHYQADARRLWDAAGWTTYCSKALARTKRILGVGNVLSIPHDLRRQAKAYWDNMRWLEANPI